MKKSKDRYSESVTLRIALEAVSLSRPKVITADSATIRPFVTKCLSGKSDIVFLGIDPGLLPLTVSLIVWRKGKRRDIYTIGLSAKRTGKSWQNRFFRVTKLATGVGEILSAVKAVGCKFYVAIEGYSHGSSGTAIQTLAEIKQAVLQQIYKYCNLEDVLLLPPTTWKACLAEGAGGYDKEGVQSLLIEKWPVLKSFGADHNKYDSYAMASVYEQIIRHRATCDTAAQNLMEREEL